MKIIKRVLPIFVIVLAIAGCDILKQLKKGIAHTASRINSVQAIDTTWEFAFVDIEYIFTGTGVSDEKAVFERKDSGTQDTVEIAVSSTIYTDVDTLKANETYIYTLWLLDDDELTEYDEITVKTLPVLEMTLPRDTLTGNAIEVKWNKLTYEGEDYLNYKVALYDGEGIDILNPDPSMLLELTNPLEEHEVSLDASDNEGTITLTESAPDEILGKGYIVKVTTDRGIGDKLSNKSTAIKPFWWIGL